ncbi:phage major capsid protein [Eubacterium sp. AB3007]|uniref:phage major capsid protein n=1 Tax=Eubacterium sp. AB3007 TaxID=1392487 RepID=UPI000482B85C|nr:phage major capsid protein [Eubacterium sp. AB3007]
MTIVEMREKRAKLWNTMEGFLDTHRNDMGVLSAEDDATYARMEDDLDAMTNEIKRMERREAREAEMNKPVNDPIRMKPEQAGGSPKKTGRASDEYKEDFDSHLHGRPLVHNVLSTTPDADGGYLVPEDFERQILMELEEENVMRKLCKVITTQHERKIPVAVGHSVAQWTLENAPYQESNPTFGQKQIDAYKLTDLARVSNELLQDAVFDIQEYLMKEFARAFGIAEEEAFCVGTGVNQPTGLFTANGADVGITASGSTGITADEMISLVYSLKSPYRRNAKFLMHDQTISLLRKLKDGNGAYLWQPSVQAGEPDRLLGYELYTSPYVPTVEAGALAIAFGDFKNYWIGDRQGRTVQRLNELYATNGQIGYISAERVDGKMIMPEGVKLLKMK